MLARGFTFCDESCEESYGDDVRHGLASWAVPFDDAKCNYCGDPVAEGGSDGN